MLSRIVRGQPPGFRFRGECRAQALIQDSYNGCDVVELVDALTSIHYGPYQRLTCGPDIGFSYIYG